MVHGSPPDEIRMRLSPATRALLEEIKRDGQFACDAAAIRAALGLQHHIGRRLAEGWRLYLGGGGGSVLRELTFPPEAGSGR